MTIARSISAKVAVGGQPSAEDLVAKAAARDFPITGERLAQFVRMEAEHRSARVLQAI